MPKSKVEYATHNITVYRFCTFNCRYCYVWRTKYFSYRVLHGKYDPVEEAHRISKKTGCTVVVSFTSDPYQPVEFELKLTRRVLQALSDGKGNRILILTKNPVLALRDLDIMKKHGDMWLGTTVVTLRWSELEPKAPSPLDRLAALRVAKKEGVKTWLSIEPIIPGYSRPDIIVRMSADFVDMYVLGSLNHVRKLPEDLRFSEVELAKYYKKVVPPLLKLLEDLDKPYIVKKELKRYLEV